VRAGGEAQALEAEIQAHGRGRIAVNMKISPLLDASDSAQGVAVVIDDVTEQRDRDLRLGSIRRYLPPQMVDNIHRISQLELGGERREVTCMYVNVYELSHLPPGLRPQQIMETMNRYLALATDCIHAAGGIIDKYMGNVVMVLFNTQLNPMHDHARRALDASLAIRAALAPLYGGTELGERTGGDQHYYRIGIHSGVATLGNVGSLRRREFTAIGDTINLSKRLEESARDGQVIISEDAFRLLDILPQHVRFEEREPLRVKGRQQYTRIYEVFHD
jgi:adenylate cyclase